MGCITTYLTEDGVESRLYNELVDRFGQAQGEVMYLNSKLYNWSSLDLNVQGEPTLQTLLTGNSTSKQKSTPDVIYDNIVSTAENVKFVKEPHGYFVEGSELQSVSRRVDKYVPYTGNQTDYNYADDGHRYHDMFEKIGNGNPTEDVIEATEADKGEQTLIREMKDFMSRFPSTYKLLPEIRMADTAKGIAGTIDLLVIKPNGKADIYDLKTVFETPGTKKSVGDIWDVYKTSQGIENYKAKRYALQTTYYKELVETSDPVTGRLGVEVENVYIVPVEVRGEPGKWTNFKMRPVENISRWQSGTINFADGASKIVREDAKNKSETDLHIKGLDTASNIDEFLDLVIGKAVMSPKQLNNYAYKTVENFKDMKFFKHQDIEYKWQSENKVKRLEQVKRVMASKDEKSDEALVTASINTLNSGVPEGIYLYNDDAYTQLKQLHKMSFAKNVFALSDVPGYEAYSDVLAFQRDNGTVELVKMTRNNLTFNIEVKNKQFGTDKNTIAGNHFTYPQARSKNITLQNTMEDREKLRLAMIAMQLKETNPDIKVDRLLVSSASNKVKTTPAFVRLDEILPQIKTLYEVDSIKSASSGSIKQTLDNSAVFEATSYEPDSIDELLNYMDSQLVSDDYLNPHNGRRNTRHYIKEKLERYANDEIRKDELLKFLLDKEKRIRNIIATESRDVSQADIDERVQSNPEFIMLAKAIFALQNMKYYPEMDISDTMFGPVNKYVAHPTQSGMKTLDAAIDYGRKAVDNVKRKMLNFKNEKVNVLTKLQQDAGGLNIGFNIRGKAINPNRVTAMGTDAFLPLVETKTDAKGREFRTMFFVKEDSKKWSTLTKTQQDTIKWFNKTIQESFREAHPEINPDGSYKSNWPTGMIPITKSRPNDFLYKVKKQTGRGNLKRAGNAVKSMINRTVELSTDQYEYRAPEKSNHRTKLHDYFIGQVNPDGSPSQDAFDRIGLDRNFNLIDGDVNDTFQLDLDTTVTSFVEHYAKKTEFEKVLPGLMMYRSIFKMYENAYFLNQKGAIMNFDNWIDENMFGEKEIMINPAVDKLVSVGIRTSAFMMLGFNWKTISLNGIQGYGQAVIRSITASMTRDKRFPGLKFFGQAHTEMMKAMTDPTGEHGRLLTMLADAYLPEDLSIIKGNKYKVMQTGMLSSQTSIAVDRGIERSLRILYIVAQMKKDGTFDAHSIEQRKDSNGNLMYYLKYNEHLDERFKKNPKLKDAIKKSLAEKEEGLDVNERMTLAYDWRLRQKYKNYSDLITPSADKDLMSAYRHYGAAGAISFMRSWARDYVVNATGRSYAPVVKGDYRIKGDTMEWEDGAFKAMWETYWETLPNVYDSVKRNDWSFSNFSEADKQNLTFTMNSLIAWTILGLIGKSLLRGDGEDDKKDKATLEYYVSRMLDDVMTPLSLGPIWGIVDDPVIFLSFYKRLFNTAGELITNTKDGDFDKSWEAIKKVTPIVKDI